MVKRKRDQTGQAADRSDIPTITYGTLETASNSRSTIGTERGFEDMTYTYKDDGTMEVRLRMSRTGIRSYTSREANELFPANAIIRYTESSAGTNLEVDSTRDVYTVYRASMFAYEESGKNLSFPKRIREHLNDVRRAYRSEIIGSLSAKIEQQKETLHVQVQRDRTNEVIVCQIYRAMGKRNLRATPTNAWKISCLAEAIRQFEEGLPASAQTMSANGQEDLDMEALVDKVLVVPAAAEAAAYDRKSIKSDILMSGV